MSRYFLLLPCVRSALQMMTQTLTFCIREMSAPAPITSGRTDNYRAGRAYVVLRPKIMRLFPVHMYRSLALSTTHCPSLLNEVHISSTVWIRFRAMRTSEMKYLHRNEDDRINDRGSAKNKMKILMHCHTSTFDHRRNQIDKNIYPPVPWKWDCICFALRMIREIR
jgi:hypothetical protein